MKRLLIIVAIVVQGCQGQATKAKPAPGPNEVGQSRPAKKNSTREMHDDQQPLIKGDPWKDFHTDEAAAKTKWFGRRVEIVSLAARIEQSGPGGKVIFLPGNQKPDADPQHGHGIFCYLGGDLAKVKPGIHWLAIEGTLDAWDPDQQSLRLSRCRINEIFEPEAPGGTLKTVWKREAK